MVSENRGVRPTFLAGVAPVDAADAWPDGFSCAAIIGIAPDNWKGATKRPHVRGEDREASTAYHPC